MPTEAEQYVIDCAIVWAEMMSGQQLRHDVWRCQYLLCGAVSELQKAKGLGTIPKPSPELGTAKPDQTAR